MPCCSPSFYVLIFLPLPFPPPLTVSIPPPSPFYFLFLSLSIPLISQRFLFSSYTFPAVSLLCRLASAINLFPNVFSFGAILHTHVSHAQVADRIGAFVRADSRFVQLKAQPLAVLDLLVSLPEFQAPAAGAAPLSPAMGTAL